MRSTFSLTMQSPLLEFLPTARRGSADSTQSFETAVSSHTSARASMSSDPVLMARLNALNLSSVPKRTPTKHPSVASPTSPLSSRSPSLPRRFSSCHASTSSASDNRLSMSSSNAPIHQLPPLSPLSSMYDPNSTSASGSEEDASCSSSASSDSEPTQLMHTRSMCEHGLRQNLLRGEVVNGAGVNLSPHQVPLNQTPFRKAISQRQPASANLPAALRHRFSLDQSSNPTASVAHEPFRARSESLSTNFDMPRGKVQHLPPSVTRPATPSRLPRPKVFIRQNSTRSSVVDAAAVKHVPSASGSNFLEPQLVVREIPFTPSQHYAMACEQQQQQLEQLEQLEHNTLVPTTQFSAKITNVVDNQMYFTDEDEFDSQLVDPTRNSPSDALSSKVRRAVSALRSISFQSTQIEDFDTAWGQTLSVSQEKQNPSFASLASAKWRRARGKVVNRSNGKQFECYSENDACSLRSSGSNFSQRDRSMNGQNHVRGFAAMRMRANFGGPHKRSLWAGARRERQQPHAVAAQLLVSGAGHGFLAASTDLAEQRQALATVSPSDAVEPRNSAQRGSVDKYVEFIHASAQRETKGRFGPRNFPSRVLRLFRRKWN